LVKVVKTTQDQIIEAFKELKVHGIKGDMFPWLDVRQINKVLRTNELEVVSALKALKAKGELDERITSAVGPNGRVKTAYYRPPIVVVEAPAAS
jgi:hypothetical protein